jgi:hypothetical protein
MKLDSGEILRFEKNQVIGISQASKESDSDCIAVPMTGPILFGSFFMKAQQSGGNEYFKYDAVNNNCQDFILGCLQANSLSSSELTAFIKQNVEKLVSPFIEGAARTATDLAAAADVLINGKGLKGCGIIQTKNGLIQRRL